MQEVLHPGYVDKFKCIASDCEDPCCCGWRVTIDKESYERYQYMEQTEGGDLFRGKLTRDNIMPVEGSFAEVVLSENSCPFLTEKKLCRIQEAYGEDYLSVTCATFPRSFNRVNGKLELALNMSCPHAARLALSDTAPMRFSLAKLEVDPKIYKIPTLNSTDTGYPNRVHPYFDVVRSFIIALLQNRKYVFEDRLIILGRFCNDLDSMRDSPNSEVIRLVEEYTDRIDHFEFNSFIKTIPVQPAVLLKALINLIEFRLKTNATGKRFLECFDRFRQGINYTDEQPEESLAAAYTEVKSRCYDHFMNRHEHIFENYFVNYVFKTLFPFGQEKSIYKKDVFTVSRTAFTEFMLLAIQYAMIKNLAIGTAGYYKDQFGTPHVLKVIQSFAKNIDTDVPYLQTLLKFFKENNMLNFACAVMLVKS